jgi:hypothetical protein
MGLVEGSFVLGRGLVSQLGVTTLAVVKHFEVFEQCQARVIPRGVVVMVNQFYLERSEEAFDHGIVIAVAPASALNELRTKCRVRSDAPGSA